jgi:hypothetical protein
MPRHSPTTTVVSRAWTSRKIMQLVSSPRWGPQLGRREPVVALSCTFGVACLNLSGTVRGPSLPALAGRDLIDAPPHGASHPRAQTRVRSRSAPTGSVRYVFDGRAA